MYARMIVMMVISLFTTRITFRILGVDNYGIYNIVGGIIVFFTFINQALTTATRMIRDPIFGLLKRKYYFCHIGKVIAKGILL